MDKTLEKNEAGIIKPARTLSLRARLILGNMLITFLALLGMGVYVYYRTQNTNDYLTTQLSDKVYQQAQENLFATSREQTLLLNNFYVIIRRDISNLGASIGEFLSLEDTVTSSYWDGYALLSRLPTGSWDNSNEEVSSIFIPAAKELTDPIVTELNTIKQMDFIAPPLLNSNPEVVAIYFGGRFGETVYFPNIDLAAIVPPDFDVTSRPWYTKASPVENPERESVWSDPYLDAALNGLVITCSTPVYDSSGSFRGVTAMDIQLNKITELVTNIQVGSTGYAFLLDRSMHVIAMPPAAYEDLGILPDTLPLGDILSQEKVTSDVSTEFWDLLSKMVTGESGLTTVIIGGQERYIIYQPVDEIGYSLAIIVPSEELLTDALIAMEQVSSVTQNTVVISIALFVVVLFLALLATLGIGNRLTRPLIALTKSAEQVAEGNLEVEQSVTSNDEIGTLASAFNIMTRRLRELIENLERRVAERTTSLERRTTQIQAAVEVGNAVASIRNIDELLQRITQLISQRFGFYHVGIFLLDDRREYAVLMASNSPGGQKMLLRGHKLQVGKVGIVGLVTSTGTPRIALDVGEDAIYFDNPDLPETRSEMALPLRIGKEIFGALDIQSTQENAFSEEDIQTLNLMADQVAVAIQNTRLLEESQKAVETTRRAFGETSIAHWQELIRSSNVPLSKAIRSQGQITPVKGDISKEAVQAMSTGTPVTSIDGAIIHIPIQAMGNSIGALRLEHREGKRWTNEEINALTNITSQLGLALESARLYSQITERARQEALVADISSKLSSSIEIESIMHSTVEEIGKLFKDSEIVLQLKKETGQ